MTIRLYRISPEMLTFSFIQTKKMELPTVPGRGLNTEGARELRLAYLKERGIILPHISGTGLEYDEVQNHIESWIGSVELPVGLVGPLLFRDSEREEFVYCAAATVEGALIASMNRGARAISLSGGFEALVLHQRMLRSPMFRLKGLSDAGVFAAWVRDNFGNIKKVAESYSNHATLLEIIPSVTGRSVQLKFYFETRDASGQNMTTTCTWHAIRWINEAFQEDTGIEIKDFIIEGNGASDKKASIQSAILGRGIHVVAECRLTEEVIQKVLRTTSADFMKYYTSSLADSILEGMTGYNINVANAVAAIFAATGQDLGSVNESAFGVLVIEKEDDGLYLSLNLPNLVIGTVGGGTNLPAQKEALELMACHGSGKVERFARLIAGFALGLEISTYSAIISGGFAKAHEKLGRNKPVRWITKSEINKDFIQRYFSEEREEIRVVDIDSVREPTVDNGILSMLAGKATRKLTGFVTAHVEYTKRNEERSKTVLLKSKALDSEVIEGLHMVAACIDTELADLLYLYSSRLEYAGSHIREIEIYENLSANGFTLMPKYYGAVVDNEREIYLFGMELLTRDKLLQTEQNNSLSLWDEKMTKKAISAITEIHRHFMSKEQLAQIPHLQDFTLSSALPLYRKFAELLIRDGKDYAPALRILLEEQAEPSGEEEETLPMTLIHNDFNTRNVTVRKDGQICIYDWELAVRNIPHRDIVEFLAFSLQEGFEEAYLFSLLDYHYSFYENYDRKVWYRAYRRAVSELILSRLCYYEVAGIVSEYEFSGRVIRTAFRMLSLLDSGSF